MRGRRGLLWLVAGLALALLTGRWLAGLYGDWAFHHALGADAVWRERLLAGALWRAAAFSLAFGFLFANLYAVRQSIVALVLPRSVGGVEFGEAIPPARLTALALLASLVVAAIFATVDHEWMLVSQALHGVPFGEIEPYLERDLGFYVHTLPLEREAFEVASVLVVVTGVLVLTAYVVTPSVRWDERGLYVSTWVRRHLGVLGGVGIALVAWNWRLDRFGLLVAGSGPSRFVFEVRPFSIFDHRILLPYLAVIAFLALPVAVVFAIATWRGNLRIAFGLVTAVIVAGPVARIVLPLTVPERLRGLTIERPYAATRMLYTRRAFGVDQVETAEGARLGDREAQRWVSAWDPAAMTRFLELERRGTDVAAFAWSAGAAGLEASLLRAAPRGAPPGTYWPGDRLRTDLADATGLPRAGMLPTPGGDGVTGVNGVLVHPGAARYAVVADPTGRLAAPPFETTPQRVALAWDQQNPRLLATDLPVPRTKLVSARDVTERLARLVPFLAQGETVLPVVRSDSLYWVVELFTTSESYPLSERLFLDDRAVHYAQHAATAVVQAQTGAVTLLPVERPDPVMRTWLARFPAIFTPRSRAPRWMATGLPPAVDWALVQGAMMGRTGVHGDTLPVGQLARVDDADADLVAGPPTLFQLDSSGTLGWGVPVATTDRLAGVLLASGGLRQRTTLLPPGGDRDWTAILEDLQEAADRAGIGRVLKDSRRGRVQTIPTAKGPLFVQSFYDWPADGPPRLAGVVALRGSERRVGRTLAEALSQGLPDAGPAPAGDAFRAQVGQLYDAMGAALRAGDWRAYGDAWAALGRLLGRPR
ncbi:MAG: UPF0182 family protein [Gemmatimonadaceae bacterium]|nr:UPF0182 family protein [Gemmatimonadaceae bacterium]